jgi:hypothetical protein
VVEEAIIDNEFELKRLEALKACNNITTELLNCDNPYRLAHLCVVAHNRFETLMKDTEELIGKEN